MIGPLELRHFDGFTDEMFDCFRAQCRLWCSRMTAIADGWRHLGPQSMDPPNWDFGDPRLSKDRTVAALPIGNKLTRGIAKLYLDSFPKDLYAHCPGEFRRQLHCRSGPDFDWTAISDLEAGERDELLRMADLIRSDRQE